MNSGFDLVARALAKHTEQNLSVLNRLYGRMFVRSMAKDAAKKWLETRQGVSTLRLTTSC